jgi:hypothetical protein
MANQFQLSCIVRVTLVANNKDSILEGCQELLAKKGGSHLDATTLVLS